MINIEQITSRLAKLPDQALQQYAMMHKSDPYIMALAVSESNRRKQMRASAQAGPAQEQPKVADMALAEMGNTQNASPEQMARLSQMLEARKQAEYEEFTGGSAPQSPDESGIAALPAGEMNFADGGIVAFADGGDVERYQDRGLVQPYETPYDRMNRQNREAAAAAQAEREAQAAEIGVTPYGDQMSRMYDALVPNPLNIVKTLVSAPGYGLSKDAPPATKPASAAAPTGQTKPTPQQMEAKVATAAAAPTAKPKAEAGLGGTKEAAALRGAPGASTPSVDDAKRLSGQFLDTKTLRSDLEKFYKDEEAAVEASRRRRNEGKPEGKAYSKYEELLAKEEAGAAKEKDEALGVAIFKAGLGMMAGSSPNAFENIGKGAMAGLDEYSGAMKDMKKAAKERQKAMGEIEQARRAEARDDWKTARDFEDKADARMAKAREFGVKGIMDITGKDAEIASGIYKTQVEQKGRMDVANVQGGYQLAAANTRSKAELTQKDRAFIADKAMDNVNATLKANVPLQMRAAKDPAYLQQLVQAETARLMAAAEGRTMTAAPGAGSPGGTSTTGWGKASVVNP